MRNSVEFMVWGSYALFTDPITKIGGEKCSYHIPTYQALKGILESVYWKPTIVWVVDKVRVMHRIKTQTRSAKPVNFVKGGNSLSIYTYLADVNYQVQAHFEWNMHRPDLEKDRNENKHHCVSKRMLERGGRRDIFLGTRECQGYVEPCRFGEGQGFYDEYGSLAFDLMFHGFDYPSESGEKTLQARFWRATMENGIITFPRPDSCTLRRIIKKMKADFIQASGLEEEGLLEGCKKEEAGL